MAAARISNVTVLVTDFPPPVAVRVIVCFPKPRVVVSTAKLFEVLSTFAGPPPSYLRVTVSAFLVSHLRMALSGLVTCALSVVNETISTEVAAPVCFVEVLVGVAGFTDCP